MKIFLVAEIGSNWEGSVSKAEKIIKECKKSGANAVKFQMWKAVHLYKKSHPNWNEIKRSELTFEKAKKIKNIADKNKIEFFCSTCYPEAVTFLESINVKTYKIASRTCLFTDPFSFETINQNAITGKPVFISMGMGGNKRKILGLFSKRKPIFC